jgi:predicted outer membrane repeat protein
MAVLTVSSTANDGAGSLRQAIASAKAGDTIQFASNLIGQTITLRSQLEISPGKNLTIDGANAAGLTISGNKTTRVFYVNSNQDFPTGLTVKNLIVTDAYTAERGGGILATHKGNVTVENVQFNNNVADKGGGAIYTEWETNLTVTNSKFDRNQAIQNNDERGAGAIAFLSPGNFTVKDSEFTNNRGINGGAINSLNGKLTIENSRFINNDTTSAKFDTGKGNPFLRGYGGAVYTDRASSKNEASGTIQIKNSVFEGNRGRGEGGAAYLYTGTQDKVIIESSDFKKNEVLELPNGGNGGNGGGLVVLSNGLNKGLTIRDTAFTDNTAASQGGGLWTMDSPTTITGSLFSGNKVFGTSYSNVGGAMALYSPTDIIDTKILSNSAGWVGGGITANDKFSVTVKDTVFYNNTADNGTNNWGIQQHTSRELTDKGGNIQWPPKRTNNANDYNATAQITLAQPTAGDLNTDGIGASPGTGSTPPVTPDSGTDSVTPDTGNTDSVTPPVTPDNGTAPATPDSGTDPVTPDTGNTDSVTPPVTPDTSDTAPDIPGVGDDNAATPAPGNPDPVTPDPGSSDPLPDKSMPLVARTDTISTTKNTPIRIDLLSNDSFESDRPFTLKVAKLPTRGRVKVDNNTTPEDISDDFVVYVPQRNITGRDSFTYQIDTGDRTSNTATVRVAIASPSSISRPVSPRPPQTPVSSPSESSATPKTLRYEAENLSLNNYKVEFFDESRASAERQISLRGTGKTSGSATGVFKGAAGTYQVRVGYYDENDGKSSAAVTVANQRKEFKLDKDLFSDSAMHDAKAVVTTHAAVTLRTGDRFEISARLDKGEFARFDYIEFIPISQRSPVAGRNTTNSQTQSRNADVLYGEEGNDFLDGGQGNDFLDGGQGNDILVGVEIKSSSPGRSERDVLIGGKGADRFQVGDEAHVFYNDGKANSSGLGDYALIKDFKPAEGDRIHLHGKVDDYRIGAAPSQVGRGSGIYYMEDGQRELIAVVENQRSLNLRSSSFRFS